MKHRFIEYSFLQGFARECIFQVVVIFIILGGEVDSVYEGVVKNLVFAQILSNPAFDWSARRRLLSEKRKGFAQRRVA
jgi:uncharacterized protein with LGFP repeats